MMRVANRLMLCLLLLAGLALPALGAPPGDLCPVTLEPPPTHPPVTLVQRGRPKAAICLMTRSKSRPLRLAVKELQECIQAATGATLPVATGELKAPAIVIGDCPAAAKAGLVDAKMPVEGFAIATTTDHVFIVGHDDPMPAVRGAASHGTAWGVLEFLERFVGVRWYWPTDRGGRSVPKTATLAVPPTRLADAPVFLKRQIWPPCQNSWNGSGQQLGPLHTKLRHNNAWPICLVVHSPHWGKVPEYVANHPEVFQRRSDGSRNTAMICYGHPKTLELYLANIARHFDEGQKAHMGIVGDAITVSPNDAAVACTCPHCQKLWDPKGGRYGTASRILADFVQRLAAKVKARWPGKTVIYLPYVNYTTAPEGCKFPGNVEVQLCGMPGIAQYKEPSVWAAEQANIDRWAAATGRKLQNWHYSCWPADKTKAPYQYPHVLKRFYQHNRAKLVGSFINGTTDHWPRFHVSLYCWMKLLWNPDFDVDAAIAKYCRRMYGPAADTLRELLRVQTDGWENSRWPGGRLSPKAIYGVSYPPKTVARMRDLLAQARREAKGHAEALQHLDYVERPFQDFFQEFHTVVEGKGARPLVAQKVAENPVIDGKLDDQAWTRAPAAALVKSVKKKEVEPKYPTRLKAIWTLDGVTFGFHCAEPSPTTLVRKLKSRDDSMAWWDDNVELFLDVTGKREGEFYQLIINPNCAVADFKTQDPTWNVQGAKIAAFVGKDFWSVEVYLPLTAFPDAVRPGTGVEWFAQFTRHRLSDSRASKTSLREYTRLNFKFGGPSRNLADFAPVRFVE